MNYMTHLLLHLTTRYFFPQGISKESRKSKPIIFLNEDNWYFF